MLYLKKAKFKANHLTQKLYDKYQEARAYNLAKKYQIAEDYKRIYLFHIRKTGGTSLNYMFLSLGGEDGQEVYSKLAQAKKHRIIVNDKIFLGWNKNLIELGTYFYAFSHTPSHKIKIPDSTFTVTCLRNPCKRVISHYLMLLNYKINGIDHPCMKTEGSWLGENFEDFLSRIPKEHLMNQLYMFSSSFDIQEAFTNITNLSHFFFTEEFDQGVAELSSKLNLSLNPIHTRKTPQKLEISPNTMKQLEEKLAPEFELYRKLKEYKKAQENLCA